MAGNKTYRDWELAFEQTHELTQNFIHEDSMKHHPDDSYGATLEAMRGLADARSVIWNNLKDKEIDNDIKKYHVKPSEECSYIDGINFAENCLREYEWKYARIIVAKFTDAEKLIINTKIQESYLHAGDAVLANEKAMKEADQALKEVERKGTGIDLFSKSCIAFQTAQMRDGAARCAEALEFFLDTGNTKTTDKNGNTIEMIKVEIDNNNDSTKTLENGTECDCGVTILYQDDGLDRYITEDNLESGLSIFEDLVYDPAQYADIVKKDQFREFRNAAKEHGMDIEEYHEAINQQEIDDENIGLE